jgi:hypothetical protein
MEMLKKTLNGIFDHLLELPWYVNIIVGIAFKVILTLYHAQLFPHELWISELSPYSLSEKLAAGALGAVNLLVPFVFIWAGVIGLIFKLREK